MDCLVKLTNWTVMALLLIFPSIQLLGGEGYSDLSKILNTTITQCGPQHLAIRFEADDVGEVPPFVYFSLICKFQDGNCSQTNNNNNGQSTRNKLQQELSLVDFNELLPVKCTSSALQISRETCILVVYIEDPFSGSARSKINCSIPSSPSLPTTKEPSRNETFASITTSTSLSTNSLSATNSTLIVNPPEDENSPLVLVVIVMSTFILVIGAVSLALVIMQFYIRIRKGLELKHRKQVNHDIELITLSVDSSTMNLDDTYGDKTTIYDTPDVHYSQLKVTEGSCTTSSSTCYILQDRHYLSDSENSCNSSQDKRLVRRNSS